MTAPLLAVDGLVKHFVAKRNLFGQPTSLVRAVDGVSFSVKAGETLAIVGESGCGKSTVGRLVLRLIEPTAGRVTFDGQDVFSLPAPELRRLRAKAQLIFQDPYASLNPRLTVGETLAEPLLLHTGLSASDRKSKVGELLDLVGLRPLHAQRYPHEFSGGQRQRIAIARALAADARLIVCDEPVSALDVSIRAQVLNLLKDLQQRLGLAYIFISHDLAVVKHVADRIAVMYLGRIVETGTGDDLFREPRHPYTQALLSAIPSLTATRPSARRLLPGDPPSPIDPPAGCHLHPRCPHAGDVCRTRQPDLAADATSPFTPEHVTAAHATACHRWPDIRHSGSETIAADRTSPELQRLLDAFAAAKG